jgi:hypothetical protein
MTDMDLLDLLGSAVTEPHTTRARLVGAGIHHVNGAVLAVADAYAAMTPARRPPTSAP